MSHKVGIIGRGVVGDAVAEGLICLGINTRSYDIKDRHDSRHEMCKDCDMIFVCVGTPSLPNGKQDLSQLHHALTDLRTRGYRGVVVIKSTVLPGTTLDLAAAYKELLICNNPEFLREKHALDDFNGQDSIIIGSEGYNAGEKADIVSQMYLTRFPEATIWSTDFQTAELAKYMHNVFLACKVAIFNEFYEAARAKTGSDQAFFDARDFIMFLHSIGPNHTRAPGIDGKFGFGGMCFIKDTLAWKSMLDWLGMNDTVLGRVIEYNKRIRPGAYDGTEKTGVKNEEASINRIEIGT